MNKIESPFRTAQQRTDERAAKRHAVLAAAVAMFNERGFHATSLDEVAASLGISKPTIYHYLGNKDQVLLECLTMGLQQLIAAAESVRTLPGTGLDRLKTYLRRYAEVNMDEFGRCVILTAEESLSPDSVQRCRALKRQIDAAMRKLIVEGIADGSIAATDPMLLAFTLAGALNWPARWHDPDGALGASDVAERMVTILTDGIAPRT